jgi:hypothetical protein
MDFEREHRSASARDECRGELVRREFVVGCLRSAAVAGVVGVSALLALRTLRSPDSLCQRGSACGGCPEWAGCALPAAVAWRASGSAGKGDRAL